MQNGCSVIMNFDFQSIGHRPSYGTYGPSLNAVMIMWMDGWMEDDVLFRVLLSLYFFNLATPGQKVTAL